MFITNVLAQHALDRPEEPAVIFENTEWTYRELYHNAKKIANYLQSRGYEKGDILAQFMLNSELFMAVYYGVQLAGCTLMPINTKLAPPEVDYIFMHSEAKVIFYDDALLETKNATTYEFEEELNMQDIRAILADDSYVFDSFVSLDKDDTAVVMYTSGTTGKPKGVMLTHRNIYETAEIWAESMNMVSEDCMYICTPLFHCAGVHTFAVPMMYKGGTVIISEAFSPDKTLDDLVATKATIFFGVPAMYIMLLNKPNLLAYNFEHMRLFKYGAAPMPYELIKQLKEFFPNVTLRNAYGQTENSPAATSLADEFALEKIGSVGKPLSRTEIKIVSVDGEEVATGEVGEICVRGPQVMKGYLRNPEETKLAILDGWLYTGDLGRLDEEGFLYIVDRKKDMIIRGGENIYPVELEEVLYQIPEILEAAVVGVPHEVYGEVPKAFVVFKEGKALSEEEILTYMSSQLAKYKIPVEIEILDTLPRNASGKVLKHTLRPTQNA